MTPHFQTPRPDPNRGALLFACCADGWYLAGVYAIEPTRRDGGPAAVVYRDGAKVRETAGNRCLVAAQAWAQNDATTRGISHLGQQPLL